MGQASCPGLFFVKAITGINKRQDAEHYSSLIELEGKIAKIPEG